MKKRQIEITTNTSNDVKHRSHVFKLALLQIIVSLLAALLAYFLFNVSHAFAVFFGGAICALANLFFAGRLFVTSPDLTAQLMVKRFYRSESLKILFTLAMFFVFIVIVQVKILPFIIMYMVAAVFINWLYLLLSRD